MIVDDYEDEDLRAQLDVDLDLDNFNGNDIMLDPATRY